MGNLSARSIDAWRRTFLSRRPRIDTMVRIQSRNDLPPLLPRHSVLVVGVPAKWAVLACPCGTGHTIELNLANPRVSRWAIVDNRRVSIKPSIDVQDPAGRCHFWLQNGRVRWVQPPRATDTKHLIAR